MTEDEWQMADGFAPVSRLHYCEHPRACSAPEKGRCPRCQMPPRLRKAFTKYGKTLRAQNVDQDSIPTFLDDDFDSWGER